MDKLNIVIFTSDIEQKAAMKQKFDGLDVVIAGYSDYDENGKLKSQGLQPDVVLMVLKGAPSDDFYKFVQSMLCDQRNCTAMLLTDSITVDVVNQAATCGICNVMPMESSGEEILDRMKRVHTLDVARTVDSNAAKKVRSKVISVGGGKGGTGKTMFATNLAVSLAQAKKRVMLIDLDLQFGDVAFALDLDAKDNTIVDLIRDRNSITIENINTFARVHNSGISVLCAPTSAEYAEYVKVEQVEKIISICRMHYEYIIIDLPSGFDDITISAFDNSNDIVLVYNPDILSLKNAKVFMGILDQLQMRDKCQLILNKETKGIIKATDFERTLSLKVLGTVPMDIKNVPLSINNGSPMVSAFQNSPVSLDLGRIRNEFLKKYDDTVLPVYSTKPVKKKRKR